MIIMTAKRQDYQAKKKGVVAPEVEKEEVDSDKTENQTYPTHEEFKEMFGFRNLSVHHNNGDGVADLDVYQVRTYTDEGTMINPTT